MSDITISKAAQLSGKSQATIRRWAAQKIIPARKTNDGHWTFNKDELIAYLSTHSEQLIEAGKIKQSSRAAQEQPVIKLLETSLERERRINDELRTQLSNATAEIFKLTQEIKAILSKDTSKTSPTRWIKTKVQEALGM